jgi:hypothetical protein
MEAAELLSSPVLEAGARLLSCRHPRAFVEATINGVRLDDLVSNNMQTIRRLIISGELENVLLLDPAEIDFLAEVADSVEFAELASVVATELSKAHHVKEAAAWLHYGGVAMRKAGAHETTLRFHKKAKSLCKDPSLEDRYMFSYIGQFSAKALAGDFQGAGQLLKKNERMLTKDSFWLRHQNLIERWRFARVARDTGLEEHSAFELRDQLPALKSDPISWMKVSGLVSVTLGRKGSFAAAYSMALPACFGLLVSQRDWAMLQYIEGLEYGLKCMEHLETASRILSTSKSAKSEWNRHLKLSTETRKLLFDVLAGLYRHYLDHHADTRVIYDNPYIPLLPEESSIDREFSEQLLKATNEYKLAT